MKKNMQISGMNCAPWAATDENARHDVLRSKKAEVDLEKARGSENFDKP